MDQIDESGIDFQSFDDILSTIESHSYTISMFENLCKSNIPDQEKVPHLYTVMRNPMIVECIDELLYMFIHSPCLVNAIAHTLDGWKDQLRYNTSYKHNKTLINKLKYAFTRLIGSLGEKTVPLQYYRILQEDFTICLLHAG